VKILSRYPFNDRRATVSFQQIVEEVKPFQIIVWVGIANGGVSHDGRFRLG